MLSIKEPLDLSLYCLLRHIYSNIWVNAILFQNLRSKKLEYIYILFSMYSEAVTPDYTFRGHFSHIASVAQLDARPAGGQVEEVAGLTPARSATFFHGD